MIVNFHLTSPTGEAYTDTALVNRQITLNGFGINQRATLDIRANIDKIGGYPMDTPHDLEEAFAQIRAICEFHEKAAKAGEEALDECAKMQNTFDKVEQEVEDFASSVRNILWDM